VFLYGQTGSGKTHTHEGITAAAVADIFGLGRPAAASDEAAGGGGSSRVSSGGRELVGVGLSVVEVYCEKVRCLLSGREVELRGGGAGAGGAEEAAFAAMTACVLAAGQKQRAAVGPPLQ
jgi:hypothetical protein